MWGGGENSRFLIVFQLVGGEVSWLARGEGRQQREGGGRFKGEEECRFFKGCGLQG